MKRKSLDIVRHIYGEDAVEPLDELIERDDALNDEYVALRETKALLDARPRHRPDPQTVSAVLEQARQKARSGLDRPPILPLGRLQPALRLAKWTRPISYAAAACCLVFAGYWFGAQSSSDPTDVLLAEEPVMNETIRQSRPKSVFGVMAESEVPSFSDEAFRTRIEMPDEILSWDDTEDLLLIQWRIGSLEENIVGSSWDRAVPLGGIEAGEPSRARAGAIRDTALREIDR